MAKLTGGQILVQSLENRGVETVFGMPGINILHIYDALRDSRIRHILIKHEQSAAFMADAYARVTGKPGVCLTTAGPGLTNAITGLATAYNDSIPVLLLAGEISSSLIGKGKGVLHEIDQTSISTPVTKAVRCVSDVAEIPEAVEHAFRELTVGRPRPVYIGLPDDILGATSDFPMPRRETRVREDQAVDEDVVENAVSLLAKSSSPVILAGGGVIRSGASPELVEVAELLSSPVVTTVMGAGSIPGDHPLFLGRTRMPRVVDAIFQEADVMLAVGTRFSALSMRNWALKIPENLIHVDIDPKETGKNYAAKVGIRGDAKLALRQIANRLRSKPRTDRSDWQRKAEGLGNSALNELKVANPKEVEAVMDIRVALERDAIVTADTTILSYWMQRILPIYEPRTFLYPFGYVAMGYALPAAIASKIAFPERQVVALCGDGGFMLTCQELTTAVENGANIPILLNNNASYGILKHIQTQRFGGRHIGVDLRNPDFAKLAESFGARSARVDRPGQIRSCLSDALQSDRPTIIEIQTQFTPPS